ncbi:FAD synthetase family protein [Lapidilactobacillus bayanensis]|uniref:FAD synthetase family protein n=1 Tax=Lapidilactobacillus bayanensis TaxID=2485998 RepID=UPI0013DDD650|nr:FAD synthetase family protein [Lapidilactobacillus bayanensis]
MEINKLTEGMNDEFDSTTPCVLALGFFDGVHLGHQQLITQAKQAAIQAHLPLHVLTLDRHASTLFNPDRPFPYLTTLSEKANLMAALGVDRLYVATFNRVFANLTPLTFVNRYLVGLGAQQVVVGFDYTYGRRGAGTVNSLQLMSQGRFTVQIVDAVTSEQQKVSSTRIRGLIMAGQLDEARVLLGHDGQVLHDHRLTEMHEFQSQLI